MTCFSCSEWSTFWFFIIFFSLSCLDLNLDQLRTQIVGARDSNLFTGTIDTVLPLAVHQCGIIVTQFLAWDLGMLERAATLPAVVEGPRVALRALVSGCIKCCDWKMINMSVIIRTLRSSYIELVWDTFLKPSKSAYFFRSWPTWVVFFKKF